MIKPLKLLLLKKKRRKKKEVDLYDIARENPSK